MEIQLNPKTRKRLQTITFLFLGLTVMAIMISLIAWVLSEPGSFEPLNVLAFSIFSMLTAVSAWLSRAENVAAPASVALASEETISLGPLRYQIADSFSAEELRALCFDLGIRYENLSGDTVSGKSTSLVAYMQRRRQLTSLMAALQRERPQINWPLPTQLQSQYSLRRNVRATWIEGILKQSVTDEIALELKLTYQPHALTRKVSYVLGQAERTVTLPMQTLLQDHGSLLILGEPGSGKTMTLLQLAETLLDVEESDPDALTPVVFNLSSWAAEQRPLTDWLIEEFLLQYQTPRQTSGRWLGEDRIILLLDGLDEVAADARDACVQAINAFQAEHNTSIVVCCRVMEYEALKTHLNLGMGLRIQPLSRTQVNEFLNRPELQLTAVRHMLQTDDALQELAQTPLFLSVMTLAYRGINADTLGNLPTPEARRTHLYHHYVTEMLHRRPLAPDAAYQESDVHTWLVNLAFEMQQHDQSVFYIERLQPTWLRPKTAAYELCVGLVAGLIGLLLFGTSMGLILTPFIGLAIGVLGGIIVGIMGQSRAASEPILLFERLRWVTASRSEIWQAAKGAFIFSIGSSMILGLGLALIIGFFRGWQVGIQIWAMMMATAVGVGVVVSVLQKNIQSQEFEQRLVPNQGIRNSVWNAMRMGVLFGLIYGFSVGLVIGVVLALMFGLRLGLLAGLTLGLCGGLSGGLMEYGGQTVLRHYSLRWLLARQEILPFPFKDKLLVAYLNAMTDRILLRRVGGGWVFIHRTLLDYFASLHPDAAAPPETLSKPSAY